MKKQKKNQHECKCCGKTLSFKLCYDIFYGKVNHINQELDFEEWVATSGNSINLCKKCFKNISFLTGLFKGIK